MTHEQITQAIQSLRPNAEWTLIGDNYADLIWSSTGKAPTLTEIEEEIAALPAKKAALQAEAVADKASALAKLAALGLTTDDLKALGL